ncbi:hypothetical protein GCM10009613_09160 [Pseudonocardia kongjuensis]|uniref:Uncharacterized protein n=1 Tax=Pseudonocardia kongjuensis TaxID=102227 RepID=A0ABN1XHQ4_9PSEU
MDRATAFRALRDVGAAAWFGGSLMGVSGLNAAADAAGGPADRQRVAQAGWSTWTPIARAALAATLTGGLGQLATRRGSGDAVGIGLTVAAAGVTAGTAVLGGRDDTPASAIRAAEWAVPALLAGVILSGARR